MLHRRFSGDGGRIADSRLPPPLIPVDFGYWKLAPGGLGLLGLGVYAGFRKQVKYSSSSKRYGSRASVPRPARGRVLRLRQRLLQHVLDRNTTCRWTLGRPQSS